MHDCSSILVSIYTSIVKPQGGWDNMVIGAGGGSIVIN